MIKSNTQREAKKIRELAREYEKKGFSSYILPQASAVPSFLRNMNYEPDLIVKSDEESFVIEVSSSDTAERLREISKIVSTIEKKPRWDFILVMTNPRIPKSDKRISKPPSIDELHRSFMKVKALSGISEESKDDFSHAILLSAWAVVEGALRIYLSSNTSEKLRRSPRSIVRDAVMYGYITASEGSFLDSVAEIRNAIAHGASTNDVKSSMIKKLLTLSESLVTTIEPNNKNA